jgi:DNA-binding response OmpR family regulator
LEEVPVQNENSGRQRRVLVVEDEVLICMLIETILDDAGYQVLTANTLQDALDVIARESFDIAILDLNLQGKKVYPAAEALAAKGVPFVFATGGGTVDVDGFNDRPKVQKPFQETEILDVVSRHLD